MRRDDFIGSGWAFPAAINRTGTVRLVTGPEELDAAIRMILSTVPGERVMRPDFGCNLEDQVFDAMNASMLSYVENLVKTAILYHEPRIDADQISVTADQPAGRLDIKVSYVVRGANSRFNVVFPFYLTEG